MKLKEDDKILLVKKYESQIRFKEKLYQENITFLMKSHQEEIQKIKSEFEEKALQLKRKFDQEISIISKKLQQMERKSNCFIENNLMNSKEKNLNNGDENYRILMEKYVKLRNEFSIVKEKVKKNEEFFKKKEEEYLYKLMKYEKLIKESDIKIKNTSLTNESILNTNNNNTNHKNLSINMYTKLSKDASFFEINQSPKKALKYDNNSILNKKASSDNLSAQVDNSFFTNFLKEQRNRAITPNNFYKINSSEKPISLKKI